MIKVVCQRANVCADEMFWGNQPIKSMIYVAVVGNRPCGCSPNNLRYVNLLPEALTISLKALWCLWPTLSPPVLLSPEALHFVWRPLRAQVPHLKGRCECAEGCEHLLRGMNPKLCPTGVWEATSDDSGASLASFPAADWRMREWLEMATSSSRDLADLRKITGSWPHVLHCLPTDQMWINTGLKAYPWPVCR